MNRIKLAYVCPWFSTKYRGPLYNFLFELSKYIDVVCICSMQKYVQYYNKGEQEDKEIENISSTFKIHRFKSIAPKDQIYPFNLREILDEEKPNIIQSDEFFRFTTIKAGEWARKNNVPLLINSRMRYREGKLRNFIICIFKILSKKVVRYSKKIIATQGECSKQEFLRWFPEAKEKIEVITTGLDISKFQKEGESYDFRKKYNISKNKIIVLSVARVYPVKRIDLLVKAFSKAKEKNKNLLLVNIGPFEEEEKKKIDKIIEEENLNKDIIFTGSIDNKDLAPAYKASDIFINTSETEGICFSFLEAMAFEIPIIAFDVGGNSGVVEDKKIGFIEKFGDIDSVAEDILKLSKSNLLREKMGKETYKKLKRDFDIKKNVQRLLEVIR